jgi:hypothetical protein
LARNCPNLAITYPAKRISSPSHGLEFYVQFGKDEFTPNDVEKRKFPFYQLSHSSSGIIYIRLFIVDLYD